MHPNLTNRQYLSNIISDAFMLWTERQNEHITKMSSFTELFYNFFLISRIFSFHKEYNPVKKMQNSVISILLCSIRFIQHKEMTVMKNLSIKLKLLW